MKGILMTDYKNIPITFDFSSEKWEATILGTVISGDKPSAVKRKLKTFVDDEIVKLNEKVINTQTGKIGYIKNYNPHSSAFTVLNNDGSEDKQSGWYSWWGFIPYSKENLQKIKRIIKLEKEKEKMQSKLGDEIDKLKEKIKPLILNSQNFPQKYLGAKDKYKLEEE